MLLLAAVAMTGCRLAEHGRRAAIDAFASFVLGSVLEAQQKAPLTQGTARTAPVECAGQGGAVAPTAAAWPPHSIAPLPAPRPRIAAIDLKPALAIELCRLQRVSVSSADLARVNVEARMALAEMRGVRLRRIVIVTDPSASL
ncbi:MAG TPA: hypothetical protein VI670_13430 [Thermoanaerobaculia bacterium]